jgi:excisionase family DNA binding protein
VRKELVLQRFVLDEVQIRSAVDTDTEKDKGMMKIKEEGYVALPLVSITEAAGYLGVSRKMVYQFIEFGEVTAVRVGRRICIEQKSLERLRNGGSVL